MKIAVFYVYLLRHLAVSLKLMVDYDNVGPSLQLFGARFLNFILSKLEEADKDWMMTCKNQNRKKTEPGT